MFGLGKRKEEQNYDDVYVYEDEYEDDYLEYEDEEYNEEVYDRQPQYSAKRQREKEVQSVAESGISKQEEEELRFEIDHLEETVERLSEQLEAKQEELYNVTNLLTEKESLSDAAVNELRKQLDEEISQVRNESEAVLREYKNRIELLEDELSERKRQVRTQDRQVDSVKQSYERKLAEQEHRIHELQGKTQQQESLKNDLANIIIETKEQQRETITRAQWEAEQIRENAQNEAQRVLTEASMELRLIKQETEKHREQLIEMKNESGKLFDQLIIRTEKLSQQEIRGGDFTIEGKRAASEHVPDISPVNRRASL